MYLLLIQSDIKVTLLLLSTYILYNYRKNIGNLSVFGISIVLAVEQFKLYFSDTLVRLEKDYAFSA